VKSLRDFDHLFEVNIPNTNEKRQPEDAKEIAVIYDFIFDKWY